MVELPSAGRAVRPPHAQGLRSALPFCFGSVLTAHRPSWRVPIQSRHEPGKRECACLLSCKVSAGVRATVRGDPETLNSRQLPRSPWSLQVRRA